MYFDESKNKNPFIAGFLTNPTIEKWLKKGVNCLMGVVHDKICERRIGLEYL